ncbi:MAG TPA: choice-of-anchor P family protein, partial [Dokdonella sp.]
QVALAGACPDTPPEVNGLLDDFVFFTGFDPGNLGGGDDGGGDGGGFGGLPPTGANLIDVQLSVLGTDVPALPLDPDPNTEIDLDVLGITGATLVLNEQTRSGDGVSSLAVGSNALHLTLGVAGLVNADVIVAHSAVSLDCP